MGERLCSKSDVETGGKHNLTSIQEMTEHVFEGWLRPFFPLDPSGSGFSVKGDLS